MAFRLTIDPLPLAGQLSETKPSVDYSAEDLKQAANKSVKKHLEQLDTDFLKALDFDIAQARKAEDNMVSEVCLYGGKPGHPPNPGRPPNPPNLPYSIQPHFGDP